ncbi:hypothetical protein GCM10025875_30180 [Litorihabitans aurantiacus]|uniref:Amidase domain-containing protein n=1 Tax=Litorihabitans aurantiacus TaxID=1930061 RepID=A0AA38CTT1_9MICO|nr:amidase family protein [Litorihabitans aurantiacus]GMA33026.1 hypothetical protein GCM10025875_30180 [Litorihabitans aurantiacus]
MTTDVAGPAAAPAAAPESAPESAGGLDAGRPDPATLADRLRAIHASTARGDAPAVWIHLRPLADLLVDAATQQERADRGEHLPLLGVACAVKDNIDVAGTPTTAAHPPSAALADADAPAVARLRAAGAVVVGKVNMDQFATGLVGTRSPYGAVPSASSPDRVAGGRARARAPPSGSAWWTSPSGPTPRARAASRPRSTASSV